VIVVAWTRHCRVVVATSYTSSSLEQVSTTESAVPDFRIVVDEHSSFIWRVLRRLGLSASDADDASQQVFMIYAERRQGVPNENLRSFLYGTAVRVASNWRRKDARRYEFVQQYSVALDAAAVPPDQHTELEQARSLLDRLLAQLPDNQRRVLILVELEQLEVAEAASLEGIPVGTAASRLRLARSHFKALLERAKDENPFGGET
jgi:RNA polymerase sigma-70 factor, ECF subfamily